MPINQLKRKVHSPHRAYNEGKIKKRTLKGCSSASSRFKKPSKNLFKSLFKKLLPYLIIAFILSILLMVILFAWYSKDLPSPDTIIDREQAQSTKIYDRTGETLLYEIHGDEKRTLIQLADIPEYAKWAAIDIEDKNFYKHQGISILGLARSVLVDIFRGSLAQGGSTLTQQFVKNAILTTEKKFSRKIKEWILSYQIEKKYTKDEILQMYFNEIPYGSTAYGIESASMMYFDKSAKDLTLAEAAILAALPQAPTYYSPYGNHYDALIDRQHTVLDVMVEQDHITAEEAEQAKNEELNFKKRIDNIKAPHFVFYVKEILTEKYGERMVEQGGLKVITTLDWDKQQIAEDVITEQAEKNLPYNATNAALVSVDVDTSQIVSMVGSKDYFDEDIQGQFNVTVATRQPGSSFKPIIYAKAFDLGYTPDTTLFDLKTSFAGGYSPSNYTGEEYGPVSLRQALAGSLNISAVKLLYLVGLNNAIDLADKLGYTTLTNPDRYGLSLVLGGGEVKPIEHVNAFSVFAREGIYKPATPILKVEDENGEVLEEYEDQKGDRVLSQKVAQMVNSILSDNNARAFTFGENNYLTLGDRPVAAKTGTTNDYHDAWTVGYTPTLATAVWVGNNDNTAMSYGADGSVVAAPIWRNYMRQALSNQPISYFNQPEYKNSNKPMLSGEMSGETKVKIDKNSGLLATEYTPEHLVIEKTYKQVHSILFYVDKNDPLGDIPDNPAQDPYFYSFEEPVLAWADEQGYNNQSPPTEYDNIHLPQDQPDIQITSPFNSQEITSDSFTVSLNALAPRGIAKIKFYFNNQLVETIYQNTSQQTLNIPFSIANGNQQLKVVVYDDLENTDQDDVIIYLNRENSLEINWLNPNSNSTLSVASFPLELMLYISDYNQIKKVDFYYRPVDSNQTSWISYSENPTSSNISAYWTQSPASGSYKLYPLITDYNGNSFYGPEITVSIEE